MSVPDNTKQQQQQHHLYTDSPCLCPCTALCSLVAVTERLILDFPNKMTEAVSRPYYRALIFCLTRRSSTVRLQSVSSVRKLLGMLGGAQIALALISEIKPMLDTQNVSCGQLNLQNIEGSRPEWCISSMIYSRDTPFWLETVEIQ